MRRSGKTDIVSGAAQGMGAAAATRFAKEGAHVVLTDINVDAGQRLADTIGARFARLDVANEAEWSALIEAVLAERGGIDGLVNNAGIYFNALIEDTQPDAFRALLDINLIGPWLGMRAVVPHMKSAGAARSSISRRLKAPSDFADAPPTPPENGDCGDDKNRGEGGWPVWYTGELR